MNLAPYIERMERNQLTIVSLVEPVPDEQVRWRPDPGAWSILEVVNHLHDEEREDFRQRIDFTLHRRGEPWPPIDPEGWVVERKYNERNPYESLENFIKERTASLAWLRELRDVDWDAAYEHPRAGTLRAGDIMTSWLAHDYLHLRQLVHRHLQYTESFSEPYSSAYAGRW